MKDIFVFGSNESGIHGKGAALYAKQHHGAINGRGFGLQGESFAIPTKDYNMGVLPLGIISSYVEVFKRQALGMQNYTFVVTPVGCGLAGLHPRYILPMFHNENSVQNIVLHHRWIDHGIYAEKVDLSDRDSIFQAIVDMQQPYY